MIWIFLLFWIISAFLTVHERQIVRMMVYFASFSLISSVCFLLLGAPDVAMAEAVISALSTIIFIIAFEKYYTLVDSSIITEKAASIKSRILPLGFTALLFALFMWVIPDNDASSYLKDQYIAMFSHDIGGENAVTAIYLGYRMYDTLFETLMLLICVVAVLHLSTHRDAVAVQEKNTEIDNSEIAVITKRVICPLLIMFGVYLIMNGHVSAGGGFQGGVVLASFFICRYMIRGIYDIRVDRVIIFEKLIFLGITLLTVTFIFFNARYFLPLTRNIYLVLMNMLIGLKVSCGFLIIFYRFIVFERNEVGI